MKRAVIYARVSSRKQADDGVSMDAQIEQCSARAAVLGAQVARVFRDDGISGRSTKGRAGFLAAVAYCEAAPVDFFITWSTSRFARNAIDLWVHQDQLKALGTRLECLNADIDDDTDAGFINRVFMGAMDQMVSRQIARDTLRSMKQSASEGYFTGGRVPFGYRTEPDGKRARLLPDDDEAPTVRRAFTLCLQGLGALSIGQTLNDSGMLRRGERWKKTSLLYLLRNELYTGIKTFNRANKKTGQDKPRSEWVQVESHPALVSRSDFEKVQIMMKERAPARHEGGTPRSGFVFSGLLRCGVCGQALQVINGTGRGGVLYNYYGCCAHRKGQPRCLFRNVRADQFDDWLTSEVLSQLVTVDVMRHAVQEVADQGGRWAAERAAQRAGLVRQLRDLEGRRNKLYDLLETHGKDTPDLSDVGDRLKLRNAEIRAVQARLDLLEVAPTRATVQRIDPALAVDVMREVIEAGDVQKKRAFMGAFLEGITVSADRVVISYRAEALVGLGHPAGVRNEVFWLPEGASLRTIEILRPYMLAGRGLAAVA
jgi:DNA invertase Pin-like site-specific DNA recombinase